MLSQRRFPAYPAGVTDLAATIAAVRARLGNSPVTLIGVTKKVPPDRVDAALAAGLTTFGENKIQEARAKIPLVSSRARWHFIGHLQSNKARDAVELFDLIHSVDSVKLAAELDKHAARAGKTQPILLEVNVSGEASKYGLAPADVPAALDQMAGFSHLRVDGLMTIPPAGKDARPFFRQLRELRDRHGLRELSMGMSHDFEIAVEEGATMIRIGTAIFGERQSYEPLD